MNELYLAHHGIKGQKWGVRRFQDAAGRLTDAGKRRLRNLQDSVTTQYHSKVEKRSRKKSLKSIRGLTDEELTKRIERIKLEKKYKDLTMEDIAPGKKTVNEILGSSGKKVATMAVTGAMAYAVKVALTKKFDAKEAANYIGANPNKK